MSILKKPVYPQKVEVVNQNGTSVNPQQTEVINLPMTPSNSSVYVSLTGGSLTSIQSMRPNANNFNVSLDNILLLQSDGGFFAIPLNTVVLNLTPANLNNMLSSYKTAYSTLVSGVTAATLHFSKLSNSGTVTSEVYNLKD